jgi:hypothetical protein
LDGCNEIQNILFAIHTNIHIFRYKSASGSFGMMLSVPELMDVVGIATIIYSLVVVANNHIPNISTKDNPVIFKNNLFYIVIQDIFDAVGDVIHLNNLHRYLLTLATRAAKQQEQQEQRSGLSL